MSALLYDCVFDALVPVITRREFVDENMAGSARNRQLPFCPHHCWAGSRSLPGAVRVLSLPSHLCGLAVSLLTIVLEL